MTGSRIEGWMRAAALGLVMATAPGCFVFADDELVERGPTGTLTLTWSVANATDADVCADHGARDLELLFFDSSGRFFTDVYAPCDGFEVTVELPTDTYSGKATLVDDEQGAVSTTLPLHDLRIEQGEELVIDVDFPTTSML